MANDTVRVRFTAPRIMNLTPERGEFLRYLPGEEIDLPASEVADWDQSSPHPFLEVVNDPQAAPSPGQPARVRTVAGETEQKEA